jgi:hypothetical protein
MENDRQDSTAATAYKKSPMTTRLTNETKNSHVNINKSDPEVWLYGRIAAGVVGKIGEIDSGPSLHFTVMIFDEYSGIFGVDGQPTFNFGSIKHPAEILDNVKLIRTNFYDNTIPKGVVVKIKIKTPTAMNSQVFAQELKKRAHNFASFSLRYSAPKRLYGSTMLDGEYNSSSYVAGLLCSVMGSVPEISTPGYQTPGWENPIPLSYFKGEAFQ